MRASNTSIVLIAAAVMLLIDFYIYSVILPGHAPTPNTNRRAVPEAFLEPEVPDEDIPHEAVELPPVISVPSGYTTIDAAPDDTRAGSLILVNAAHPYVFSSNPTLTKSPEITGIYDFKTDTYYIKDLSVYFDASASEALNGWMDAFCAASGKYAIVMDGAHTKEDQQSLYATDSGEAKPGESDFHTGLALRVGGYDGSEMLAFPDDPRMQPLIDLAPSYGFIARRPEGSSAKTGYADDPRHFRYVGIPHAAYITENGLTLEEYIALLETHSVDDPLSVASENGEMYQIYTVPVPAVNTKIPVPSEALGADYTLSGDNCGSIVVTMKTH